MEPKYGRFGRYLNTLTSEQRTPREAVGSAYLNVILRRLLHDHIGVGVFLPLFCGLETMTFNTTLCVPVYSEWDASSTSDLNSTCCRQCWHNHSDKRNKLLTLKGSAIRKWKINSSLWDPWKEYCKPHLAINNCSIPPKLYTMAR